MHSHKNIVYIIPYIFVLFFITAEASYNSLLYFGSVTALYEYPIIFFWVLFFRRSMPFFMLFLLGIIRDVILISPIGLSVIAFFLIKILVDQQRRYLLGKSFYSIWRLFSVNIIIIMIVQFLILNLGFDYAGNRSSLAMIFIKKLISTCLLYPVMHFIFYYLSKILTYKRLNVF